MHCKQQQLFAGLLSMQPCSLPTLQLHIVEGRHPVLDSLRGGMVPNDAHLAASGPRVQIITGPNMGGEHTPASVA